jgi:hypothetical protein
MNVTDDPRCLCETDWADGVGIRDTNVKCPLHGIYKDDASSETLIAAIKVPEGGLDEEDLVRRNGSDGITRETRFDANTAEITRTLGRIDELTTRLEHAEAELRAVYGTLKMQDSALSTAERLIAEGDELRGRYEIATGRHLRVA